MRVNVVLLLRSGARKPEMHRIPPDVRASQTGKPRQPVFRDPPARFWEHQSGIKAHAPRMVRKWYWPLRLEQLVTREFPLHLGFELLAPGILVVAQLIHPFVPDSLQVLLVCRWPER